MMTKYIKFILGRFFALPIPTVLVYRINKSTLTYEVYSEGYKIV